MTSRKPPTPRQGLSLLKPGGDGACAPANPLMDFSQLAKYAEAVINLNQQGDRRLAQQQSDPLDCSLAPLASLQNGHIVKKVRPAPETPTVIPLRLVGKEK